MDRLKSPIKQAHGAISHKDAQLNKAFISSYGGKHSLSDVRFNGNSDERLVDELTQYKSNGHRPNLKTLKSAVLC